MSKDLVLTKTGKFYNSNNQHYFIAAYTIMSLNKFIYFVRAVC